MAGPGRRDDDEFEDERPAPRPRRPRDEDDAPQERPAPGGRYRQDREEDDRPSRRGRMQENEEDSRDSRTGPKKMSVLGLISVIGGVLSLILSFIPCVGMLSFVGGGIGLVLGIIGLLVAGGSNHGKGLPIAGTIINILSIVIAAVWLLVLTNMGKNGADAAKEVESADAVKITAKDLSKEYDSNVVKADATYKGKVLEVTGKVSSITREKATRTTVELGVGADAIECEFSSSKVGELASVNVGQSVTIRGKCKGQNVKSQYVVLENCTVVTNPTSGTPPTTPSTKVLPKPEIVDAVKLTKEYASNTLKADKLYKGKYLEVKVEVQRVSDDDDKPTLEAIAGGDEDVGLLRCEFPASAKDALSNLAAKDKVTVRGTCKAENGFVTLTDCVLVK